MAERSRHLCRLERKDLIVLADDFMVLTDEVREIIDTCGSYAEGKREIMRAYDLKYMKKQ